MSSKNFNNYQKQKERALKRKYELIMLKGGCCQKCGYNKCVAALEFHHLDSEDKDFQVDSRHISNTNMKTLLEEVDKCILLCANCHREEHNSNLFFSNVLVELEKINKNHKSFSDPQYKSICKCCGNNFKVSSGKIYCSTECREKDKNYPSKDDLWVSYNILKSWTKVANKYGITRKIIQKIVKT